MYVKVISYYCNAGMLENGGLQRDKSNVLPLLLFCAFPIMMLWAFMSPIRMKREGIWLIDSSRSFLPSE